MFTKKESQILELIAKGLTSESIAKILIISINTVKTHRKNMIRKAKAGGLQFDSLLRLAIQEMNKNTH
ncbi:response regulator transcription factor [Dyadobacter sp. 3J3]|uniref:response regulator transcription factor n=1 Tax=Dyadobacter sp. 3J3 TaxID=2606600 RepID=UPI001359813E|nr:helix-turn-helix transcriptional regulator [Dyadobacter sp. 3J3]